MPFTLVAAPAPAASSSDLLMFLIQVSVLLATALLLGRLALRIGVPAIVGELMAGVLLGPSALGYLTPPSVDRVFSTGGGNQLLNGLGQLTVILLVGVVGVHLDHSVLRRRGPVALRIGLVGMLIPLGLGIALGYLVPDSITAGSGRAVFALFLGVALCVSAIPVIAKTMLDLNLLHRDVGQIVLASGAISDTVGWLLLSLVAAMATTGLLATGVLAAVGKLILVLLVTVTLGRLLVRRAIGWALRSADPSVLTATTVVILVACGATTLSLGLEAALGAFLGGLLISACPGVTAARLTTLRTVVTTVFAPIFFATAGLGVDLGKLADPVLLLTGLAVLLVAIAGKFLGAAVGGWRSHLSRWEILAVGAGMNARGVVEIVVASVGLRLGVLNTGTYTVIVALAIITSVIAPPILRTAMRHAEETPEEAIRHASFHNGHPAAPVSPAPVSAGGAAV